MADRHEERARELVRGLEGYHSGLSGQVSDCLDPDVQEIATALREVERETVERCANTLERMVIGGGQWDESQGLVAEALFAGAKVIRSLTQDTDHG